ncbi:hypothetical protein C7T35_16100 [Variovorax sp. WS11]|nr:hypothetical protein C7T35_16100 [Variovorax sp. WS11]
MEEAQLQGDIRHAQVAARGLLEQRACGIQAALPQPCNRACCVMRLKCGKQRAARHAAGSADLVRRYRLTQPLLHELLGKPDHAGRSSLGVGLQKKSVVMGVLCQQDRGHARGKR